MATAFGKVDAWLPDRVYSSVPAGRVGRRQSIAVGPMSGKSHVEFWLQGHGVESTTERVASVLDTAKTASHVLNDAEIGAALAPFEKQECPAIPLSKRSSPLPVS